MELGSVVIYDEQKQTIISITDSHVEIINQTGLVTKLLKDSLYENGHFGVKDLSTIEEAQLQKAKERLKIIAPLIDKPSSRKDIEEHSKRTGVSRATLYRWIKKYNKSGLLSDLAPKPMPGGKGKSRLSAEIDEVIDSNIDKHYLTNQRNSFKKVYLEIQLECKEKGIKSPHYNTLRRRIAAKSEYKIIKHRLGKSVAKKRFSPKVKNFPDALFPLSSVQIDHTPLDIIVVDEQYREALGRPWLTLAIDTFSRMVVGFYIGFERPSSMSVGLCLSQSILPKEEYLASLDIYSEWPCYGKIGCIHMDNALEFRSKMLEDICLEYQIDINWRPVKVPEYGGYVERLLGTFSKELHQLQGTTFNNFQKRGNYDSEKEAVLTYKELEKWMATYIVEVYHKKLHSGINKAPFEKWNEGVLGSDSEIGTGFQPVTLNPRKVLLDFMPYEWRTIQDYGVLIDGIYYYHDVLRKWINAVDIKSGKLRAKKKFKFKRDPRDISILYFLDPELKEYFPIPYRDTSRPPITKWELKIIREELLKEGRKNINEDAIFDSYRKLKEIEESATKTTKRTRRLNVVKKKQKEHKKAIENTSPTRALQEHTPIEDEIFIEQEAFKDIDDGSFE